MPGRAARCRALHGESVISLSVMFIGIAVRPGPVPFCIYSRLLWSLQVLFVTEISASSAVGCALTRSPFYYVLEHSC